MRKVTIFIIVMIAFITPTVVFGCSIASAPTGIEVKIKDCEYGDDKAYLFDVLFEKEDFIKGENYHDLNTASIADAWGVNDSDLETPLPYMSEDSGFISLLGYGDYIGNSYHNGCYQMFAINYESPGNYTQTYLYNDFKIIVLDLDYNVIHTSEVYSSDMLPGHGDTYQRFVYNGSNNQFELEEHDMFYPTGNECDYLGGNMLYHIFISYIIMGVLLIAFLTEFIAFKILGFNQKSILLSLIVSIISLILLFIVFYMNPNWIVLVVVLFFLVNILKYVKIKKNEVTLMMNAKITMIVYAIMQIVMPFITTVLYYNYVF